MSLGEKIGKACRGGEVFELISDLGGGKTAFVRGLAKGIGTSDEVSSPSFTINNTYVSNKLTLEHFDFYRLESAGLLAEQLHEDIFRPETVVAIEWGDVVRDVLPARRVAVNIVSNEEESRAFQFSYDQDFAYLFEGLK